MASEVASSGDAASERRLRRTSDASSELTEDQSKTCTSEQTLCWHYTTTWVDNPRPAWQSGQTFAKRLVSARRQGGSEPVSISVATLPDFKQLTSKHRTLSLHAAFDNHCQLKTLLRRPDLQVPNERDFDEDRTPLHWACARGHVRCVELLLAAGADPELTDASGRTAAGVALQFGHDALAFRIERGEPLADEKHVYEGLEGASLHAALDHPKQLRHLVRQQGAGGWNVRDSDGDRYPLHWAAARGAIKCAEELVGAGADVRVTDRAGHTPASVAFAARQHATYAFLAEQEQKAVTSAVGLAHGEEDDGGGEEEVTRTPPRRRDLSGATE